MHFDAFRRTIRCRETGSGELASIPGDSWPAGRPHGCRWGERRTFVRLLYHVCGSARVDGKEIQTTLRIVAIGGGEIRTLETYAIDSHIVSLAGKKNPTALFIPTASSDSEGYWEAFQSVYGDRLGCLTQALFLLRGSPDPAIAREMILNADLIYVGGGNTLRLMRAWRRHGIDNLLKTAAKRGVILSGVSAGRDVLVQLWQSSAAICGRG